MSKRLSIEEAGHLLLKLFQADALRSSVLVHDGHYAPAHQRHKLPADLHSPLYFDLVALRCYQETSSILIDRSGTPHQGCEAAASVLMRVLCAVNGWSGTLRHLPCIKLLRIVCQCAGKINGVAELSTVSLLLLT